MAREAVEESASVTEAVLGRSALSWKGFAFVRAWPGELRSTAAAVLLAAVIFIPMLGSVGLWDPWETHYGEVAREMVERNDYVHPYWESAYFFSKPALTLWLMALGLRLGQAGPSLALGLGLLSLAFGVALATGRLRGRSQLKEFWGVLLGAFGVGGILLFLASLTANVPWTFGTLVSHDGALPLFTEWGFRFPFVMQAILAVGLTTYAVSAVVSPRAGLATGFVLMTMPLYFLLARQAVTDPPFVCNLLSGIACFMVGLLRKEEQGKGRFWYAAYGFFALATLAKGLLGFGIPMLIAIAYAGLVVVDWTRAELKAHLTWARRYLVKPLGAGLLAGAVVGIAAYTIGSMRGTMFMEGPIRLNAPPMVGAAGWLGIMWGSLAFWAVTTFVLSRRKDAVASRPPSVFAFAYQMRLGTGILFFLALALPWYYEMFTFWRVDDESKLFWFRFLVYDHFARLGSGVHTTTPGGDFTYFILQGGYAIFPWVALLPGAFATLARSRIRGDVTPADRVALIATLWLAISWLLIGSSATKFHHYVFPMIPPLAIACGLFIDRLWEEGVEAHLFALFLGVPCFVLVAHDLVKEPKHFVDLFVYNYERAFPHQEVIARYGVKTILLNGSVVLGVLAVFFLLRRSRVGLFTSWLAGVMAFALWFNWSLWGQLSHHWTQRDQFWRYYSMRKPDEPIAAFLMNWRGETFYSRNSVKQIREGNTDRALATYANFPGRKWALVEHFRLGVLRKAVGPNHQIALVARDLNNKFVLVSID